MGKDYGADIHDEFNLGCGQPGGEPHEPSHGLILWTVRELKPEQFVEFEAE